MITAMIDQAREIVMINLPCAFLNAAPISVLFTWPITTMVIHYNARERAKISSN